ncbi:hypothetical protein Y1Q_0014194 [Alligator mississippiensis]|uniref:Uncharacterized protein n=1 Tax=Alligator mississippiensis TaxID=8496 RepID=A0A151MU36_ALLMI|nr:hypothetical protein Y1Q_0014194 [Alligator mississippiensis]
MAACMKGRSHQWSGSQYHSKIKALWAYWVHITDYKQQSTDAHSTIPFMKQLDRILATKDPGHGHHAYSSTDSLPEPLPGSRSDEQSPGEGPLGHQPQFLTLSTPASSGSSRSLGQPQPWAACA